jgi:hypothetical protein
MTKILKKVQLSTEQSTPKSADPTKGTQTNPYTQVEMATLQEEGKWNGGYVEGMGYIVPMMMGSDSSNGSGIVPEVESGFHDFEDNLDFMFSNQCNPCPKVNFKVEWGSGYPEPYDAESLQGLPVSPITVGLRTYFDSQLPFRFAEDQSDTLLKVKVGDANNSNADAHWSNDFNGNYSIVGSFKFTWEIKGEHNEDITYDEQSELYYLNGRPLIDNFGNSLSAINGEESHQFSFIVISANH